MAPKRLKTPALDVRTKSEMCYSAVGDISFRFLEYTHSMYDRQQRLRAKSRQTPSWQDITGHYVSDDAGPPQSRAVVCDINKEMLKVGKQKAETAGITTGMIICNQRHDHACFGVKYKG